MCLNGWGGRLHDTLLPYLAAEAPEVLCLQEVVHTPATDRDWLTYRDGDHVLPQRANLFREVAAALPDHAAIFCPAARGALWDGEVPVPSLWGLATFVHASLPIIGQVQAFVHKGFSPDGFGAHPRSRSAHAVRLHDFAGRRSLGITHMHGLRDPAGKRDTPARAAQARRLVALADSVSGPGDIRIVCGDFNVGPDSATLALLARRGFTELVTARGFSGTRTALYRKPGRFADYMLIDRVEAVAGFDVVGHPEVSDHCPLVLTLGP